METVTLYLPDYLELKDFKDKIEKDKSFISLTTYEGVAKEIKFYKKEESIDILKEEIKILINALDEKYREISKLESKQNTRKKWWKRTWN